MPENQYPTTYREFTEENRLPLCVLRHPLCVAGPVFLSCISKFT